jgi:UDP-glucose 4-epimerase
MKNVLVTGGAGFIGGHIVDELVNRGMSVIVVDNESSSSADQYHYNDYATYFKYDITDFKKLERVFRGTHLGVGNIDTIFHLAALSRIPYSIEHPVEACNTNYMGTLNVLEIARHYGVKRVLYSSTSSAYGLKNKIPLKESMTPDCLNPYSASKVGGENLCKMYHSLYGMETIIFRYFNVYGERHPLKGSYAPVIGIFDRQSKAGEPMTIVGDGLQTRDFTYVQDVVQANMLAAETTNEDAIGEIFNVGTGENHSVLDVAELVGGEYIFEPPREGEARDTLADTTKIKNLLGFKPKTKLEDWMARRNNK